MKSFLVLFALCGLAFSTLAPSAQAQDVLVTDLITENGKDVGTVRTWTDGDLLHVKVTTEKGRFIHEIQAHVATSLDGIPQNGKGEPQTDQFRFKREYKNERRKCHCTFDLKPAWTPGTVLYIAVHVELKRPGSSGHDDAWGDGLPFPGDESETYYTYALPAPMMAGNPFAGLWDAVRAAIPPREDEF